MFETSEVRGCRPPVWRGTGQPESTWGTQSWQEVRAGDSDLHREGWRQEGDAPPAGALTQRRADKKAAEGDRGRRAQRSPT